MAVNDQREDETVTGAAQRGFAGGFLGGVQDRFRTAAGRSQRAGADPSWRVHNQEAVALNTRIMAATADRIALLGQEIQASKNSLAGGAFLRLKADRQQAVAELRAMQESMAHDEVNVDVEAGAHTEADVASLRQDLDRRREGNDRMRTKQQQRDGLGTAGKTAGRSAPVRNAAGQTLADLTAPAPGEDPLPGMSQPLILDAVDAVQGIPPRRAATGIAKAVVMNPAHVAQLASLENSHGDGLESAGSHFGR